MKREDFPFFYQGYKPPVDDDDLVPVPFRIPKQFLGDEEVVAVAVRRYPQVLLQNALPVPELLDSKEIFLSFIQSERMMHDSGDLFADSVWWLHGQEIREKLFGLFSARLRANAELLLKAAPHIQHGANFANFSRELSDDCAFALQLAKLTKRVPKNALERFSDRVKADREVVLTLVQKTGLCLKDADESLKSDLEIIRAACKQNAAAILHCAPGPIQQSLIRDKDFMLNIFSRWHVPEELRGRCRELYDMLSDDLKLNYDAVFALYCEKGLTVPEFPTELTSDRGFWMDMIRRRSFFWLYLPEVYEYDPAFATAIENFLYSGMVQDVFDRFPFLRQDRGFWSTVFLSDFHHLDEVDGISHSDLIQQYAPEQIHRDHELMQLACKKDADVFGLLNSELQQSRYIVETVVENGAGSSSSVLELIPAPVQCMYPDLIAKHLQQFATVIGGLDEDCASHLADELWSNMDVLKVWFENDGHGHARVPAAMKCNPEFGLLVAEHCEFGEFSLLLPTELRSDKSFMSKAVNINKSVALTVAGALRQDFDFTVLVYSTENAFDLLEHASPERVCFLHNILEKAKEKIEVYEGYSKAFVYGVTDFTGLGCHLPVLVRDKETSFGLKKLIADLLGVPPGKKVPELRRVIENLQHMPRRPPN